MARLAHRKNGEAHILACHHVSYGNHKIIAAPSAKMPTKMPITMAISIIPSWVDGGFDYAKKNGATRSIVRNGETRIQCMASSVIWKPQNQSRPQREDADEDSRDKGNFHDTLLG
jgi:hypothetical protein